MVSHMIGDVLVFALLYLQFFIPYSKLTCHLEGNNVFVKINQINSGF